MLIDPIIEKYQAAWEKRATVRSKPRRMLDPNKTGYFYPMSKQPLCLHPLVSALDEKKKEYILIQSLYKYSNDIAHIETEVVNRIALKIANKKAGLNFEFPYRVNAFTVIVDEAYHAYVALDCMNQIKMHTKIDPLPFPKEIEITKAMKEVKAKIDKKYYSIFEIIAVCIAENTLTKEIITLLDEKETNPFFQNISEDHLSDESRHSGFFNNVLKTTWGMLSDDFKIEIGKILPSFLFSYLSNDTQIEFEEKILQAVGFNHHECDKIIQDTYGDFNITKNHPMMKNIIKMLSNAQIFDHEATKKSFSAESLL